MIILHKFKQGSEEWKVWRKPLFTGSGADKVLKFGKIPYSKAGDSSFGGNYYTRRGHALEDEALELYEQIKGVKLERPGGVTNTDYPDCGYSPDALAPDRGVEVKAFQKEVMESVAKNIPLKILAQCHFGMFICKKALWDLVLYNPDLEDPKKALIIITIRRKPAIQANFKRIFA